EPPHPLTDERPWCKRSGGLGGGATLGHAPLEALDAPTGVHQLLATGVEGMAVGADLDVQLLLSGARDELVAAGTPHVGLHVVGMDACLHRPFILATRTTRACSPWARAASICACAV